jgi:glycerol uptake facilitator-like aquaporin
MNPGTTIAFSLAKKNAYMGYYFLAQLIGASIAVLLGINS